MNASSTMPMGGDCRHSGAATTGDRTHNQISTPAMEDNVPLTGSNNQTDHKWDDMLRAINDDLRAFWGLWTTVISPRLDPKIPTDWEVMKIWNADDVDISDVWDQIEKLQAQVKNLVDKRIMKPEDAHILRALNRLLTPYPIKSVEYFRSFVMRIINFEELVPYPMPVN
jgi:hypothetical protein